MKNVRQRRLDVLNLPYLSVAGILRMVKEFILFLSYLKDKSTTSAMRAETLVEHHSITINFVAISFYIWFLSFICRKRIKTAADKSNVQDKNKQPPATAVKRNVDKDNSNIPRLVHIIFTGPIKI